MSRLVFRWTMRINDIYTSVCDTRTMMHFVRTQTSLGPNQFHYKIWIYSRFPELKYYVRNDAWPYEDFVALWSNQLALTYCYWLMRIYYYLLLYLLCLALCLFTRTSDILWSDEKWRWICFSLFLFVRALASLPRNPNALDFLFYLFVIVSLGLLLNDIILDYRRRVYMVTVDSVRARLHMRVFIISNRNHGNWLVLEINDSTHRLLLLLLLHRSIVFGIYTDISHAHLCITRIVRVSLTHTEKDDQKREKH